MKSAICSFLFLCFLYSLSYASIIPPSNFEEAHQRIKQDQEKVESLLRFINEFSAVIEKATQRGQETYTHALKAQALIKSFEELLSYFSFIPGGDARKNMTLPPVVNRPDLQIYLRDFMLVWMKSVKDPIIHISIALERIDVLITETEAHRIDWHSPLWTFLFNEIYSQLFKPLIRYHYEKLPTWEFVKIYRRTESNSYSSALENDDLNLILLYKDLFCSVIERHIKATLYTRQLAREALTQKANDPYSVLTQQHKYICMIYWMKKAHYRFATPKGIVELLHAAYNRNPLALKPYMEKIADFAPR